MNNIHDTITHTRTGRPAPIRRALAADIGLALDLADNAADELARARAAYDERTAELIAVLADGIARGALPVQALRVNLPMVRRLMATAPVTD